MSQAASLMVEAEDAVDLGDKEEYLDEAVLLLMIQDEVVRPVSEYYFDEEAELGDISPDDDEADHLYGLPRNRSIAAMSDYDARRYTRFSKEELARILFMFHLGGGDIRIRCSRTQNWCYLFTREEVFLYGMAKLATGDYADKLCMDIFGGSPRRWSGAYKWFLFFIYDRYYQPILSMNGLLRFRDRFPMYARQICRKFNQEQFYLCNHTLEKIEIESTVLDEDEFSIPFFLDGSGFKTSTMGTGPHGDYAHTMRKDDAYVNQRSVYSGYKKMHGLTVLSLMTPDGINFIYGPCSIRQNDPGVMLMSGLDEYLVEMQDGYFPGGIMFAAYADRVFRTGDCICSSHKGDAMNPITHVMHLQNKGMNAVRETVEHGYSVLNNKFKACAQYDQSKLMQDRPHAKEQLAVCYLLSNISACLHGSQVGGIRTFICVPPSLEEYLQLGDEHNF